MSSKNLRNKRNWHNYVPVFKNSNNLRMKLRKKGYPMEIKIEKRNHIKIWKKSKSLDAWKRTRKCVKKFYVNEDKKKSHLKENKKVDFISIISHKMHKDK